MRCRQNKRSLGRNAAEAAIPVKTARAPPRKVGPIERSRACSQLTASRLDRHPDFESARASLRIEFRPVALDHRTVGNLVARFRHPLAEYRCNDLAYRCDVIALMKYGILLSRHAQRAE